MRKQKKLPKGWRWAKLKDVGDVSTGNTPPKKNDDYYGGEVPWVRPPDLNQEETIIETEQQLTFDGASKTRALPENAVMVSCIGTLGKVGILGRLGATNQQINSIVFGAEVLAEYGLFLCRTLKDQLERLSGNSTIKIVKKSLFEQIEIPLPPLAVQEWIVEVLQQVDTIRRKRAEARRLVDQILPAAFYSLFGDVDPGNTEFTVIRLDDVADIRSGVTKGRKLEGKEKVEVPYLRVANVQDGFLDLTEIKEIAVLPADVQKYHLEDGDILMTEGGDPDKLGRGCIWREQINGCIHQNHVFRVRPDKTRLLPEFLAAMLRTSYAKAYFFRAAKRTSNLASINSTQVRNFSFPLPPMEMQRKFLLRVEQWDKAVGQSTEALHLSERAFAVLLSRAFTGELTTEWEAANVDWIAERQTFYERLPRLVLLSLLLEQHRRVGHKAVTVITALMKYAFLVQMEGELRRRFYRFVPYHYGPWVMELNNDLKALQADGLIAVDNHAEEDKTRIRLTDPVSAAALLEEEARQDDARVDALEKAGEDTETVADPAMSHLLKRRAEIIETLRADAATILDAYGSLDHNALLKTVYQKYPAYTKSSHVRKGRKSTSVR